MRQYHVLYHVNGKLIETKARGNSAQEVASRYMARADNQSVNCWPVTQRR